jgi:transposase-like protein
VIARDNVAAMSRPPPQDRRLAKVLAALRAHGGPGRSTLYRWMRQHHDTLAAAFAETSPAWGPLATELAAVGLADADGKPPSAVTVRQTWYRVRRDLTRARQPQPAAGPVLAPDEIAPAVHAVMPPRPAPGDPAPAAPVSHSAMTLDIRPARPAVSGLSLPAAATGAEVTRHTSAAVGSPPGTPQPQNQAEAPAGEDAAGQLRRLAAAMDARKVPLPKVM